MYDLVATETSFILTFERQKKAEVLKKGATLNALFFGELNVINGYEELSYEDFSASKSAWLFPFPNRLRDGKYEFEGQSYQFPIDEQERQTAIHGFIKDEYFEFDGQKEEEGGVSLSFTYRYDGSKDYYPFPGLFQVTYLFMEKALKIDVSVRNVGNYNLPFSIGWHPYFKLDQPLEKLKLHLPPADKIEVDDRLLPTGRKSFYDDFAEGKMLQEDHLDTGVVFREDRNEVILDSGKNQLSIICNEGWKYFQVFTPSERDSIALEPMTGNINCFRNKEGLRVLSPGTEWRTKISITFITI